MEQPTPSPQPSRSEREVRHWRTDHSGALEFKPNFEEARRYWQAFWEGEIIDRPCIAIRAPRDGAPKAPGPAYMASLEGDFQNPIERILTRSETVFWAGEAIPVCNATFGPDEVAGFLGADLRWSPDSAGTDWSVAFVEDWASCLPLKLDPDNYWWKRMRDYLDALAEATTGKMLISMIDLHTNMGILSAIRTPDRLCTDLLDQRR